MVCPPEFTPREPPMNRTVALSLAVLLPAAALAGATASSFKKETRLGANYWNGQSAVDGKLETAWMVPGESTNLGEWIQVDVPRGTVDKLAIVPGWAKDDETWSDHPRIKKAKLDIYCCADSEAMAITGTTEVSFEDKPGWQIIDITDLEVGNELFGGRLRLSVMEIYPGADFPNLAVSELVVHLKEFNAKVSIAESSGEAAGFPATNAVDENPKTFWVVDPKGAALTFSAPGYGVSSVGFTHGPKEYAHAKVVKITANGREQVTELPNTPGVHFAPVPAVVGYTGSAWGDVQVEIVEVHPGTKPELAIAELAVKATNFEGI